MSRKPRWVIKRYQLNSDANVIDTRVLLAIDCGGAPNWISEKNRIIKPLMFQDAARNNGGNMPENGGHYDPQAKEGAKADPGTACPYPTSEIGARCAWLAGHYDAHGFVAWDTARNTK